MPREPRLADRALLATRLTHVEIGRLLRVHPRTSQRWKKRGAVLAPSDMAILARTLYPTHRALAQEIAESLGKTLVDLGIEAPPPAPSPPPPPLDPAHVLDSVVCAAADAAGTIPSAMRSALLAAFTRARQVGLPPEALEATLVTVLGSAQVTKDSSPAPGSPSRAP